MFVALVLTLLCPDVLHAGAHRSQRRATQTSHLRQHAADNGSDSMPVPGLQVSEAVSHEYRSLEGQALLELSPTQKQAKQKHNHKWQPVMQSVVNWTGHPGGASAAQGGAQFNKNMPRIPLNDTLVGKGDPMTVLYAIGGGTGASIGGTGSLLVDRDLLRRMHYQDKAVMILVLVVYLVALLFSASITYRQACNTFPVSYYADPRYHNLVVDGHEIDSFLETFNQPPKNITLQVAGFVQVPEAISGSVHWRGEDFHTAFTFSLDLSPWVVRQTQTASDSPVQLTRSLQDGVLPEDRSLVHNYLSNDENDLAYVEIVKKVAWPGWEELATNIKHQIRQSGFTGIISVDRIEHDELQVYKNRPWANFMHSRSTRVLCALSIVGWLIYVPYMWLRCKRVEMRSHYLVDVNIRDYWPLIANKLTADGFQEQRDPATAPSTSAPAASSSTA